MKLSVIIVNYNTKQLLKDCLESIFKYTKNLDFEVIVVDNASSDGSEKIVASDQWLVFSEKEKIKLPITDHGSSRSAGPITVRTVKSRTNLGFAGGNNLGIKIAQGQYVLLLNSDTLLKDNAFLKMVDFMDKNPQVSVLGPRLLNSDSSHQASVGRFPGLPVVMMMLFKEHFGGSDYVRWSPDKKCEVDWVMGAALMTRKEIFDKVGFLDEKMFMYMEEVEWCYRVKKAGKKIFFYPGAQITHLWQGSSKTGRKDPIINIYKGLIYFYKKHKNLPELLILRFLLKIKAGSALLWGYLTNNAYLKETYAEAVKIS